MVPESSDKSAHILLALKASFPQPTQRYKLPEDCIQAVEHMLKFPTPTDLAACRKKQILQLRALEKQARKWDRKLKVFVKPPESVKKLNDTINVVFISIFIDALDYPDTLLPLHLLRDMQVCGNIDTDSGVYKLRVLVRPNT